MVIGIGLVILLLAAILFWVARDQKTKLADMQDVETRSVEFLQQLRDNVRTETGNKRFSYRTEVKGKAVCEQPLQAELSQTPCVYYHAKVTREYEERYQETDDDGRTEEKTRSESETVFEQTHHSVFYVDDGTGKIRIDPEGAEWDAAETLSRYERGSSSGMSIKVGNFELNLGGGGFGGFGSSSRRITGHRFTEKAIAVGKTLYILGTASERDGELCIGKAGKSRFLISVKTEEELLASTSSTRRWTLAGAWVCVVAGVGFLVLGVV